MSLPQLPFKVLYVEDEKETRENYVIYLKTFFSEVYEAEDGENGYQLYKEKNPHIMIIDINLPKMNGLELLKKIREKDHTTKAIMLTAHTDKQFLLDAAVLKLTKYLVKPVSRKDLKGALKTTIDELENYKITSVKKISINADCYWDVVQKEFICLGKAVELTAKEKKLLELLLSQENKLFTYDEIFDYFWQEDSFTLNSLKNLVKRLRKKIPYDCINNVFNEGYKISI
jgi:two-component system, OmpR family, response regulator VanR